MSRQFDRFAASYGRYNLIQEKVADRLVERLPLRRYGTILDLGAGEGALYRRLLREGIGFDRFIAFDRSAAMLARHPADGKVQTIRGDFDRPEDLETLEGEPIDRILSTSALQWSRTPRQTFGRLARLASECSFALFTAGTFRTLLATARVPSPIPEAEELLTALEEHFTSLETERVRYQLTFPDVRQMLRYIHRSGVGVGRRRLEPRELYRLIREYPLDHLEFEVIFFSGESKRFGWNG